MIRSLLLGLCLLLGACAARTPLPEAVPALSLPLSLHVQRSDGQDWLLVVQDETGALRWSLFDPLGVPLARQQLIDGDWHNDGLLPPNAEARDLFAALLFALTPTERLNVAYPQDDWSAAGEQRRLKPDWRIAYRAPLDFTLNRAEGPSYRVTALDAQAGS